MVETDPRAYRTVQGGVVKKIKDMTSDFFFRSTQLTPPLRVNYGAFRLILLLSYIFVSNL